MIHTARIANIHSISFSPSIGVDHVDGVITRILVGRGGGELLGQRVGYVPAGYNGVVIARAVIIQVMAFLVFLTVVEVSGFIACYRASNLTQAKGVVIVLLQYLQLAVNRILVKGDPRVAQVVFNPVLIVKRTARAACLAFLGHYRFQVLVLVLYATRVIGGDTGITVIAFELGAGGIAILTQRTVWNEHELAPANRKLFA